MPSSKARRNEARVFSGHWPDAPRVTGSVGYGSYDTAQVNGGVSAGTDTTGFTLNASYIQSAAFSATNSGAGPFVFNPDTDPYRNTSVSGNFVHRLAPDQELGLNAFYSQGRTHFDDGATVDAVTDESIGVYSVYSRNRIAPWWQSLVCFGGSQDNLAIQATFPGELDSRQTQITWQNDFTTRLGTVIEG